MESKLCPYCHKELSEYNRTHNRTFCSKNCYIKKMREKLMINQKIREEYGMKVPVFGGKHKKVEE
jgi:endogenous inhibitor of DNA gyrase (YacG/DUF329 family)